MFSWLNYLNDFNKVRPLGGGVNEPTSVSQRFFNFFCQ